MGVTTADLHLGAMRCDVNVSLGLGKGRVEIKNLFSTRAVRDSCEFEIGEQLRMFEKGLDVFQCTKTWNGVENVVLRQKEGEKDYRYTTLLHMLIYPLFLLRFITHL